MSYSLQFTVVNAQLVPVEVDVTVDGNPAKATFTRAVIEAEPVDKAGKTQTLVLPPDALDVFAEGSSISVTVDLAGA